MLAISTVGCGNGKYLGVNPSLCVLGSDICPELVQIARSRGHEVAVCNCLQLPYRSGVFDAAICIAVIHHLASELRRGLALQELTRIVRPGGQILVYVWALEGNRRKVCMCVCVCVCMYTRACACLHISALCVCVCVCVRMLVSQFSQQDVMVDWHMQPKYTGLGVRGDSPRSGGERREGQSTHGDQFTGGSAPLPHSLAESSSQGAVATRSSPRQSLAPPEDSDADRLHKLGYHTFQRFYHVFCGGELRDLFCSHVAGVCVEEEFYDHENWCVRAVRT